MKEIDLVIPLGPSQDDYEELRYVLRSAEKHLKGLRNVFLLGRRPTWAKDVKHSPFQVKHERKSHDIIHKLVLAGLSRKLDDEFMWCSDDQMFLAACDPAKYTTVRGTELFPDPGESPNFWRRCHEATRQALTDRGYGVTYYDTHVPHVVTKSAIRAAFGKIPWREAPGWCIWSLLYNVAAGEDVVYAEHLANTTPDISKAKATFETAPKDLQEIKKACSRKKFIGLAAGAFNEHARAFLESKFPNKSRWER